MVLGSLLMRRVSFTLGQPGGIAFEDGAHDGELVGRGRRCARCGGGKVWLRLNQQRRNKSGRRRRSGESTGSAGSVVRPLGRDLVLESDCHDITYKYYFCCACLQRCRILRGLLEAN